MPITDFLSCTRVLYGLDPLSLAQRRHAKTYATGIFAASNKIVAGIAREVPPANGNRTLDKFLTEYDRGTTVQPRTLRRAVRGNDGRGVGDLIEEIRHLFIHSTADANVQS